MRVFGAVEAGGTKMIAAIVTEAGEVLDRIQFPTTEPVPNIQAIIDFYVSWEEKNPDQLIAGMGLAWFGPLNLNKKEASYGSVGNTPKLPWIGYPVVSEMKHLMKERTGRDIPAEMTTDVNASLLGEVFFGQGKGLENVMYITIGTGIGAGVMVQGEIVQGFTHTEAGHIMVKRMPGDTFEGSCPYHHDCFEGMAAGPAIEKRWGKRGEELPIDHPAWELEASYIAQAIVTYQLLLGPEMVILGGGVAKQEHMLQKIRQKVLEYNANYLRLPYDGKQMDKYIVPESLEGRQALLGCVQLIKRAL